MNDLNAPLGMHWRLDEGRLVAEWCCEPEQNRSAAESTVEPAATELRRTGSRVERYAFALASESDRYAPLGPGFPR